MIGNERRFSYGERITAMMLANWWGKLSDHLGIENMPSDDLHHEFVLNALFQNDDHVIFLDHEYRNYMFQHHQELPKYLVVVEAIEQIVNRKENGYCPPFSGISEDDEANRFSRLVCCRVTQTHHNINYEQNSKPLGVWQSLSELLFSNDGTESYQQKWQQLMDNHFGGYNMGKYTS